MLDHAREAVALVQGRRREDLDADRVLSLALVRLLEIIGEAAGRISMGFQQKHGAIPWSQIVSLRNRLIHGYDSVDMDILWEILSRDLPTLIEALEPTIEKQDEA
ncbi:MAG: DUF86 domain-containing protein [Anaerolineaceae bacterium]|nr:DUF86 domain-containing protein [Anaerolineaceae bacterium]